MDQMLTGRKLNMSQIFLENGNVVPVTIISIDSDVDDSLTDKKVVISGHSKGAGFTGPMKRWGFKGEQATRGQSSNPRTHGSIGGQTPGRVLKGKKMAGRHGNKSVTIKGLKIVKVDSTRKELSVSGPLPGARNSLLKVKIL